MSAISRLSQPESDMSAIDRLRHHVTGAIACVPPALTPAEQAMRGRLLGVLDAARDAVQRIDPQDAFAAIDRAKAIVLGM